MPVLPYLQFDFYPKIVDEETQKEETLCHTRTDDITKQNFGTNLVI